MIHHPPLTGLSRLQVKEIVAAHPELLRQARSQYWADPRCSACEWPVERKFGKFGSYLPDLCSECFRGSCELSGFEETMRCCIKRCP